MVGSSDTVKKAIEPLDARVDLIHSCEERRDRRSRRRLVPTYGDILLT
jgi:hypothetical protein